MEKIIKTEEQWRQELDPAAYEVLRHQATERPWTGKYVNEKGDGVYRCAGCGNALFNADTKFESGSGWPSFTDPMFGEAVDTTTDTSHGMVRTEVTCAQCGRTRRTSPECPRGRARTDTSWLRRAGRRAARCAS